MKDSATKILTTCWCFAKSATLKGMVDMTKRFNENYDKWVGSDGLIHCPNCRSIRVVHYTDSYEGELLFCGSCKKKEVIGKESRSATRRGFSLGGM